MYYYSKGKNKLNQRYTYIGLPMYKDLNETPKHALRVRIGPTRTYPVLPIRTARSCRTVRTIGYCENEYSYLNILNSIAFRLL